MGYFQDLSFLEHLVYHSGLRYQTTTPVYEGRIRQAFYKIYSVMLRFDSLQDRLYNNTSMISGMMSWMGSLAYHVPDEDW